MTTRVFLLIDKNKKTSLHRLVENLLRRGDLVLAATPKSADVLVVIGGDGLMVRSTMEYAKYGKPFYGINRGTYGFLLNDHADDENFAAAIAAAQFVEFPLLEATLEFSNGKRVVAHAFNDVYTKTIGAQSAKHRIFINGEDILGLDERGRPRVYSGDGLIVCTAGGSTAYNRAAGGIILDHKSTSLALTPISPFLPVGFAPQLISGDSEVTIEMLENEKRHHLVVAGNRAFRGVARVTIHKSLVSARLGFKRENSYFRKTLELRFPWLTGQKLPTKV